MKKILTLSIAAAFALSTFAFTQINSNSGKPVIEKAQKTDGPGIVFEETSHDFGKITEGTQAKYIFKFKNTGNQPLVLSDVHASCGCTTPSYTHDPVLPGKKGEINVNF